MKERSKPGKRTPDDVTGDLMARNVLFDQVSLDYYRKVGGNNISAGVRMTAKKLIEQEKVACKRAILPSLA